MSYYSDRYYNGMDGMQLSHMTRPNRFPKIFESAKRLKPDARRILSFGCSTGEECQSVAELFPDSEVVGVDIDNWAVREARRKNKLDRVHFHDNLGATGKYDLCLCLMVLFSLEKPISFERFEAALKDMDDHLNPGAVLMIYTADYNPTCVPLVRENYVTLSEWVRVHNRNQQEYHCGYYRKKNDQEVWASHGPGAYI